MLLDDVGRLTYENGHTSFLDRGRRGGRKWDYSANFTNLTPLGTRNIVILFKKENKKLLRERCFPWGLLYFGEDGRFSGGKEVKVFLAGLSHGIAVLAWINT